MSNIIMAIDQGTTGTTVLLLDRKLNIRAQGYQTFRQIYPQPGWVEHAPEDIWQSVLKAVAAALKDDVVSPSEIRAIGITNQRETTLTWHKETGTPYYQAIVWQCRRTAEICRQLKDQGLESRIQEKTGLLIDPYFSGTKLMWLLEKVDGLRAEAKAGNAIAGTVDSYLVWKLTNGKAHVTDVTNACRTLLMNIETLAWDEEMADVLRVPVAMLPRIKSCAEIYGYTENVPGLPDGIPVSGMAGDQQAALFGQACFQPGEAKCTYGTGAFLLLNTGEKRVPSRNRLLTTVAWRLKNDTTYALEGSAFIAGSAVQWLRDGLGMIRHASEVETLAESVPDSGGVVFVPAFAGLGAPHWNADARGIICGLTSGTSKGHIARAALEGIALQNVEILQAMASDYGGDLVQLKVDGGASVNNLLMQLQADFLGCKIIRPQIVETTALGAAFLAGLGVGIWEGFDDVRRAWKADRIFSPHLDDTKRNEMLRRWKNAVAKT
ncbi:MAG: glycerol kinase GlpK [Deltaproteobacteria bacterium]